MYEEAVLFKQSERFSWHLTVLQTPEQSLTVDPRDVNLLAVTGVGALFSLLRFVSPEEGCRREW